MDSDENYGRGYVEMGQSMIPSAQVLCDILNDPTVPSEAKPSDMRRRDAAPDDEDDRIIRFVPCSLYSHVEQVNAALFWSLSAWLWERGVYPWVIRPGEAWAAETRTVAQDAATPVEALAAVVREVAAQGVRA